MIRTVSLDDAAACAEIYAPACLVTAASFEESAPSVSEMRARIAAVSARYPWLVYVEDGLVVGYAYANAHRERVSYRTSVDFTVYIREGFHGRGIGRALYAELLSRVRGVYHRAYAGITLPNAGSVALHEAFGFRLVGVYSEVGRKFDRWHDVGWWELKL